MAVDGRPVKRRAGARVVVRAGDEVLLQGDRDPGIPGSRFWQTPGGGVDEGEDLRAAAVRELGEETGLVVEPGDLLGPVAVRRVTHGYSDRVLIQDETFFLLHTDRFDPVPAGLTERERERRMATRWCALEELPEPLWPACLRELADWRSGPATDLGHMDESTVPVPPAL